MQDVIVGGVAMGDFSKPGQQKPYREMASAAIAAAVEDAGIEPENLEQAFASYVYGESTCGQHALYDYAQLGIPVVNVNNNCSSGSTGLFLARQAIKFGAADCVLAFGFEEMQPGALGSHWDDRESSIDRFMTVLDELEYPDAPLALRCFGAAGDHYMKTYDANADLFAKVATKSRTHAAANPKALFIDPISVEDVSASKSVYLDYLTRLMCCPPTCGAAATVLVSERFAAKHGINSDVRIVGQAMRTDTPSTWTDPISLVGSGMTRGAADAAYEESGIDPKDVDVVELHDCFTTNEVVSYEALRLCEEGGATKFVEDGDNTFGGSTVVNPSGGLMSKGHPLGATGLAQCYELTTQLRGGAGARQVKDAKVALQHNIGLGGAGVVTLYQRHS